MKYLKTILKVVIVIFALLGIYLSFNWLKLGMMADIYLERTLDCESSVDYLTNLNNSLSSQNDSLNQIVGELKEYINSPEPQIGDPTGITGDK